MTARTNGMFHSLGKHERNDTVRFWAERDASVYWRSLMLSSLIASPIAFIAPAAFILGTLVAAGLAYLNRRKFRLEMTPTHVHLKVSSLMPSLYLPYSALTEAHAEQADAAGPGTLIFTLATGHKLRLTGVIDPVEAVQAFRALKAESAGAMPWSGREAA